MTGLEFFFLIQLGIQILHSIEELIQGFHKNNFFIPMSFGFFLMFEILFTSFWIFLFLFGSGIIQEVLMLAFLVTMFANGIWHCVWAKIVNKYVPGLITAPLHIIVFLAFYFVSLT